MDDKQPAFYTSAEFCQVLGIKRQTLYRLLRKGQVEGAVRYGRKHFIPKTTLVQATLPKKENRN